MSRRTTYIVRSRSYGLFHFLFDIFMIAITAGLWLIWIIIRELRG